LHQKDNKIANVLSRIAITAVCGAENNYAFGNLFTACKRGHLDFFYNNFLAMKEMSPPSSCITQIVNHSESPLVVFTVPLDCAFSTNSDT